MTSCIVSSHFPPSPPPVCPGHAPSAPSGSSHCWETSLHTAAPWPNSLPLAPSDTRIDAPMHTVYIRVPALFILFNIPCVYVVVFEILAQCFSLYLTLPFRFFVSLVLPPSFYPFPHTHTRRPPPPHRPSGLQVQSKYLFVQRSISADFGKVGANRARH